MTAKADTYQIITDRIIGLMEKGVVPWKKPWREDADMPCNLISKKSYRGVNVFMLMFTGFSSRYWLTFNQAKTLGGMVRKGEKGHPVIFWKFIDVKDDKAESGKKRIPLLRYYTVFNTDQVEGIEKHIPATVKGKPLATIEAAEAIVRDMPNPPIIGNGGNRAAYSPALDRVIMPKTDQFISAEAYYSTLFHELGHATGHKSRLAREDWDGFGTEKYSKEELVAEMSAAFLNGSAGIETQDEQSAAYITNWLKRLRDDKKLVVVAAGAAQRAADFIQGKLATAQAEPEKLAA